MTAFALDVRELTYDETGQVDGGFLLPTLALVVAVTALYVQANNYMMQRGRNDHAANCKDH